MSLHSPPSQFSLSETLRGAFDIMLGRPDGLKHMDLTDTGFWLSFWGLGLTAMIDASIYSMRYSSELFKLLESPPSKLLYITGMLGISFLAYGASMLALYLLCRTPDEQRHYPYAIIVNNWASPLISFVVLPLTLFSQLGTNSSSDEPISDFWALFSLLFFMGIIYASTNLLRISLDIKTGRAFSYVIATTVISLICALGLERLMGLSV